MNKNIKKLFFLFIFYLTLISFLYSHPHGLIKAKIFLEIYPDRIGGKISILIDEMSSLYIREDKEAQKYIHEYIDGLFYIKIKEKKIKQYSDGLRYVKKKEKNIKYKLGKVKLRFSKKAKYKNKAIVSATFESVPIKEINEFNILYYDKYYYFVTKIEKFIVTYSCRSILDISNAIIYNSLGIPVDGKIIKLGRFLIPKDKITKTKQHLKKAPKVEKIQKQKIKKQKPKKIVSKVKPNTKSQKISAQKKEKKKKPVQKKKEIVSIPKSGLIAEEKDYESFYDTISIITPVESDETISAYRKLVNNFFELLFKIQSKFKNSFNNSSKNPSLFNLIIIAFISFVWGVFHSIGPGHSKTLIVSYFLTVSNKIRDALLLAFLVSFFHTGGALLLSLIFYSFYGHISFKLKTQINSLTSRISGIVIIIIGIYLLIDMLIKKRTANENQKSHNKTLVSVAAAGGIVPCPVSILIMLLAISSKNIIIGIYCIIVFAAGIFFTEFMVGGTTIFLKNKIFSLFKGSKKINFFIKFIRIIGILFIITFGILILIIIK